MAEAEQGAFSPKAVLLLLVVGVLSFAGFLLAVAYQSPGDPGGGTDYAPLSNNATGFTALMRLVKATEGHAVEEVGRDDEAEIRFPGLVIMPLSTRGDGDSIEAFVRLRAKRNLAGATLVVLPKWGVQPLSVLTGSDRVRRRSDEGDAASGFKSLVEALAGVDLRFDVRSQSRVGDEGASRALPLSAVAFVRGDKTQAEPHFRIGEDAAMLVRATGVEGGAVWLLADPDLLANNALRTQPGAAAALRVLALARPSTSRAVAIDPVPALPRAPEADRNLLQLMFEPPFLAVTLALLAAALLAGVRGWGRFGPAQAEPRALPFGKRALADTTATLVARGRAAGRLGPRYLQLVRERAGEALNAPVREPEALDAWLGALPAPRGGEWTAAAAAAATASDAGAVRQAAERLKRWKDEIGDR